MGLSEFPLKVCYNCGEKVKKGEGVVVIALCRKCYNKDINRSIKENKDLISEFVEDLRKLEDDNVEPNDSILFEQIIKKWEERTK